MRWFDSANHSVWVCLRVPAEGERGGFMAPTIAPGRVLIVFRRVLVATGRLAEILRLRIRGLRGNLSLVACHIVPAYTHRLAGLGVFLYGCGPWQAGVQGV